MSILRAWCFCAVLIFTLMSVWCAIFHEALTFTLFGALSCALLYMGLTWENGVDEKAID